MESNRTSALRLTTLSSCGGCASKLSQAALSAVLRNLPLPRDPRLLVGAETADDAGVFRLNPRQALVQTVDFFTPIVDDPRCYGQIAATNALSDVYAMGGRPLTALNIMGIPDDKVPPQIIREILRGGLEKAKEAGCAVVGGHTVTIPEPIYGLSVTGLVDPRRILTNACARPGDTLILTKPLGTGIVTTAIKRSLATPHAIRSALASMTRLNAAGAELAEKGWVRAATDVTGFGVLGHLGSMCRASEVSAEIDASALPALPQVWDLIEKGCVPGGTRRNLSTAAEWTAFDPAVTEPQRILAADAQTSGGLLLCVAKSHLRHVIDCLGRLRALRAAVVGRIIPKERSRIRLRA